MPRKRNVRRPKTKKGAAPDHCPSLVVQKPFEDDERKKMQKAMSELATEGLAEIPKLYNEMLSLLQSCDPLGLIGSLALYGLTASVSNEGVENAEGSMGILPNHLEILQTLLLTLPREKWGKKPHLPNDVQRLIDILPKITQLILFQQIVSDEKAATDDNVELQSIMLKMRQHTFAVRNWGYLSHVIKISGELCSPIDDDFAKLFGFSISELISILSSMHELLEDRQTQNFAVRRSFSRAKNIPQMVDLYFKNTGGFDGTPEELIEVLPKDFTFMKTLSFLYAHYDLNVSDLATFSVSEIQAKAELDEAVVRNALKKLSHKPEELTGVNLEYMPLDDPFWKKQGIELEDDIFYFPMPQAGFSHIHTIIEELAKAAGISKKLESRRAEYLEQKTEELFKTYLEPIDVRSSVTWREGDIQWEHDLVAVIDRVLFVVEAKSHKLTPSGKRGSPQKLKKHVKDIIIHASEQSARLETLLAEAKEGQNSAIESCQQAKLDFNKADYVIRLSVTLSDLTAVILDELDFRKVGWLPEGLELAPSMIISDLFCVFEVLSNPIYIAHYLHERFYFQKKVSVLGDELDILGFYLENGFNIAFPEGASSLVISGMSSEIDKFFMSADQGIHLPKPQVEMRPLFRKTVSELIKNKNDGWLPAGIHLLSCADMTKQKGIEKQLNKLRRKVKADNTICGNNACVIVLAPESRKAHIIFYLYSENNKATIRQYMNKVAVQVLKQENADACVVFGRCVERWGKPYEELVLVEAN